MCKQVSVVRGASGKAHRRDEEILRCPRLRSICSHLDLHAIDRPAMSSFPVNMNVSKPHLPLLGGGAAAPDRPNSPWAARLFGKKDKDRDKEKGLEAEATNLRQEVATKSQRIQQLESIESSLRLEIARASRHTAPLPPPNTTQQDDEIRHLQQELQSYHSQLRDSQQQLAVATAQIEAAHRQREATEQQLHEQEMQSVQHAMALSELHTKLDEALRHGSGDVVRREEDQAVLESEEFARYEERITQAQAERETLRVQLSKLADEAALMRSELEARNKELFIKDNRLEWMQQRAAALARGDTSSPFNVND